MLKDHHSHPLFYAAFSTAVNLQQVTTLDEAHRLVCDYGERDNSGIAIAHGWRNSQFDWPQADFEKLPPAAVFDVSLHSLLINQSGSEILARHYGDSVNQLADSEWYESNFRTVLNWFANLNASAEALEAFYGQLLEVGVWSAEELLLVDENEINLFEQAKLTDRTRFWAAPETYSNLSSSAKNQITGLKLFTDGALGSRTAALNGTYTDEPNNRGLLIYPDGELSEVIGECLDTGKSLSIHAIGDRAIEQCITTLEKMGSAVRTVPELRIEHAQMIDLEMATRAKGMGITLSMQPNFTSDSVEYSDRLTAELCQANNPFRMLIDQAGFECGKDLIFGSDGMPHGVQYGLQQALYPTHKNQSLTLDEFKAGYCLADESKGHIELKFGLQGIEYNVHTVQD